MPDTTRDLASRQIGFSVRERGLGCFRASLLCVLPSVALWTLIVLAVLVVA